MSDKNFQITAAVLFISFFIMSSICGISVKQSVLISFFSAIIITFLTSIDNHLNNLK